MALRYRSYWLMIGWLLIIAVIFLSITSHPPKLFFKGYDKVEHFTAYFVLMGWFVQLYRTGKQRLILALLFIGQGLALEVVQGMSRWRTFDYWDAVANSAGVILALWWSFQGLDRLLPLLERLLRGRPDPGE